ncbi:MAG: hypothetical protein K6A40_01765 [Solobacterium sp.]|nr:hypothetical protein [Solobacterium sp.]
MKKKSILNRLFGKIRMAWAEVILFALAAGIYTCLMALLVPETSSFHDIAVYMEWWILFALIIMMNCETPLESALKTFVFFLISQPLVYLIQVPFNSMGFGLFIHYKTWFMYTIATLPMAYIGWYVKKGGWIGALILSPMLVILMIMGGGYLCELLKQFPNHLLSFIACLIIAAVLIFGTLRDRTGRITAGVIALAAAAFFFARPLMNGRDVNLTVAYPAEDYGLVITEETSVTVSQPNVSEVSVRNTDGVYIIEIRYHAAGQNLIKFIQPDGTEEAWIAEYKSDGSTSFRKL